ncbi:hypothetical protein QUC31_012436 [Theobroma cacao]
MEFKQKIYCDRSTIIRGSNPNQIAERHLMFKMCDRSSNRGTKLEAIDELCVF